MLSLPFNFSNENRIDFFGVLLKKLRNGLYVYFDGRETNGLRQEGRVSLRINKKFIQKISRIKKVNQTTFNVYFNLAQKEKQRCNK